MPGISRPPSASDAGSAGLRRRLLVRLSDESGIALVMALGIMLVLTIALSTTIYLTSSSARHAYLSNAGQKSYALAESGINNAVAVLEANYPGAKIYPGDPNLLLSTTLTSPVTTLPASTTINVASTTGYYSGSNTISVGSSGAITCTGITATTFTGCTGGTAGTYATGTTAARATASGADSATWSGTLVNVPTNPSWKWQWQLTAFGRVKNPTGPAADVVRKATAVVPVVIPDSTSVDPAKTAIDWVYGLNDVNFSQSVNVASPVYAGRDINLSQSATISETIPASLTLPAAPNRLYAGRYLSLSSPQNSVGHVNGTADPANDLSEIHVKGDPLGKTCKSKNDPSPHFCAWGATDKIWGVVHDNVFPLPGFIPPTLTCCSPVAWTAPADGTSHQASPPDPSYMGFWYLNAGLGPNSSCATSTGTPPKFDTASGTPDNTINESAYSRGGPFDLTGAAYSCTSADGQTKLAWNGTTLTIKGSVFIDGSATSSSGNARYVGKGTIILSGLFSMNGSTLCANVSGGGCSTTAPWDPDTSSLAIVAGGVDPTQKLYPGDPTDPGMSIDLKKPNFQGLLLGTGDIIVEPGTGTLVIGPMVGVYGSVDMGESNTLQFPPITFASSGTDGLTGPLPLPQLLSPIQFGGS